MPYTLLVGLVAVERLVEMVIAKRNAAKAFAQGAKEHGQGHWPAMVALHTAFLIACPLEVWLLDRPFVPWLAAISAVALVLTMSLRYWVIATLGERWNTRIIVLPDAPAIQRGPFVYFDHPNYLAVVIELAALPLLHGAWITAAVFGVLNLWLLSVRIAAEDRALGRIR